MLFKDEMTRRTRKKIYALRQVEKLHVPACIVPYMDLRKRRILMNTLYDS